MILLPVKLAGKEYPFVLDTGASVNFYDSTLKPLLGDPLYSQAIDTACGVTRVGFFDPPKATLGKLRLHTYQSVACSDLGELREVSGHEFFGLIGMEFLKDHVVSLNFDEGRLALLESAGRDAGTAIPLYEASNRYSLYVDVSGIGLRKFLIDTGSQAPGGLGASDFDSLRERGRIKLLQDSGTLGLTQACRHRRGIIECLTLGGFRHDNVAVIDIQARSWNLIGLPLLKQYNMIFDFPNKVAYFRKSRAFGQPEVHDQSGLGLRRKGGRVIVDSVDEESPLARSGVRPGDSLLKIDGEDACRTRLYALRQRLCSVGRKVHLTFQRDERPFEVFMVLPSLNSNR